MKFRMPTVIVSIARISSRVCAQILLVAAFIFSNAWAQSAPPDPCLVPPTPQPADFAEDLGERTSLTPMDADLICGQTIYFSKKRLRLSEDNLAWITKYEGETVNHVPHGKGILYFNGAERVVGFFENGLPHGQYARYYVDTLIENGIYENGKRNGLITYYYPNPVINGIRGQVPYKDDIRSDGPFMYNEISYETGMVKRVYLGEYKGDEQTGRWQDALNIRITEHLPCYPFLASQLFDQSPLTSEQLAVLNNIWSGLWAAKAIMPSSNGPYYVDPQADISPAFLEKIIAPDNKKYIPKVAELLQICQKPYASTQVTTGSQGYVILNDSQVMYAQFYPDKNSFYGNATFMFLNGDAFSGKLNASGTTLDGTVSYVSGADGSKLVGQFSPVMGRIEGPAKYTFFDPTINQTVTKDVVVVNGSWTYKTKAQEDYEKTRGNITTAWRGIFHNGNIFKKLEDTFHLVRDSAIYPFVWASVKYDLNKVGMSWNNEDGVGIIIAKNGIGDFNLTFGDAKKLAVLATEGDDKNVALKLNFTAEMQMNLGAQFSYGVESNLKNKPPKKEEHLTKATITPVVSKNGSYFSSMTNVSQGDVFDQFFNQRLMEGNAWTPEQKEALASNMANDVINKKTADDMALQLQGELISTHLEHFYELGPFQAAILTECISWSIGRLKNGLKPEYQFQLYTLEALLKYSYDNSVWATLTNREKKDAMTDRQKLIISEAMKTIEEFDKFLKESQEDRNHYRIQQIPFQY